MTTARAFAPATVANVAAAFDVMGFALEAPGDVVEARLGGVRGVRLALVTGDGGELPRDPTRNTASVAVAALLEHLGSDAGVELTLEKGLPLCSGLGSSAASAAAAVTAVNAILGSPLDPLALLPFAVRAEAVACGAAHADNAAPSLLGGICLVRCLDPLDVVALPVPDELACAVVHPHCEVRTQDARRALPESLPLTRAVVQWGNVAGLVAGLYRNDYGLIGRSLADAVAEPARAPLIPAFDAVKRAGLAAGALGCSISGSGPSVFALCQGETRARAAASAMAAEFATAGLASEAFVSSVAARGARLLEEACAT